jgi:hypothetical protein
MDEAPQCLEAVGILAHRPLRLVRRALHDEEDDAPHKLCAVGEVPVDRGIAEACAAGDLVERHIGPVLDEHLARRGDDPIPVSHGIGPRRCTAVALSTAALS